MLHYPWPQDCGSVRIICRTVAHKTVAHTQLHTSRNPVPASLRDRLRGRRACCPGGIGHAGVQEGDESHELYVQERDGILGSLKRRAEIMADTLNKLEGVTCVPTEGGGAPAASAPPSDVAFHVTSVWLHSTRLATSARCRRLFKLPREQLPPTGSCQKIGAQIHKANPQSAPDPCLYRRNPVTVPSAFATFRAAHRHQNSLSGVILPNGVLLRHCTAFPIRICRASCGMPSPGTSRTSGLGK